MSELEKRHLLPILSGSACPNCGGEKIPHRWLCVDCQHPYRNSPEARALNTKCDEHMDAAREFLLMVKVQSQKPETD